MKTTPKHRKSTRVDRFSYINDDKQKLVIPIGPRFQANVPVWTGPTRNELKDSKWLGTVSWSMKDMTSKIEECVGKGRPESCDCTTPGSILCVKCHVNKKSAYLRLVLGSAFYTWKFDQIAEAVSKLWKQLDEHRLTDIMKSNLNSQGQDFIKAALECFPLKSKKDIVNFYFNVYIPRRMSIQTRSECKMVNTDDEEEKSKSLKGSRKKARVDYVTMQRPKVVKARYLTGTR